MQAVLSGKDRSVRLLLTRGADTTVAEQDGYTPMHGAGFQGRAAIAKMLIDHGLDASDRHADGFTPLHRACWGREQRVRMRGGIERARQPCPVVVAVLVVDQRDFGPHWQHTDTVRALLEAGVSPEELTSQGKKPVEIAQRPETRKLIHEWMWKDKPIPGSDGVKDDL